MQTLIQKPPNIFLSSSLSLALFGELHGLSVQDLNCPVWPISTIPPLFALSQCQSQAWWKEEGDTNHLRYGTVSLNIEMDL